MALCVMRIQGIALVSTVLQQFYRPVVADFH